MKPGKLPLEMLAGLLSRLPAEDPRVIVPPRVGEDAAVIEFGERLLVAKTDPITFASDLIGYYAVNVNANDIATMGAEPMWFMAALLLPESAREEDAAAIFDQLGEACRRLRVTVVGGHTEVTLGLDRPIMVGCMLGEMDRGKLVTSAGARPGDAVILAGAIAVEGTALLAREVGEQLRDKGLDEESLAQAKQLLFDPGISVVPAARAAMRAGGVTAMHDPTEGGLATGLLELALASGVGLEIEAEAVPVLALTRQVCAALNLDPLGLIASGSLLITARPEASEAVMTAVRTAGCEAAAIGRVVAEDMGLTLFTRGRPAPWPRFERDELARLLQQRDR